ncbi:efflux RND transporter periplasmic adaptor subunit [Rubrivivax benzoatilyticus]|uniref:Efflux RND transporter periplasmic adaptor subunit n=1 Tax=Rubrivivax benzoatilyticus TaxID=316997 RepID=A0ABX0I318_9BURK|nr:efflux RND transporter periplasmic adaptor subunit [Rubrivivax benzoatilyticus]EGJ11014.1 RND family efflux transporter MFP subunit [Rubrivivax benzoatilyticus JA2 = ATCC BAA-35]NHL00212.1 efflux RND transporter periplasmic adaptor subunit [Rubrivivax benzoatilyticus]NHL26009.1 efflux RND transporter periplasmic adaptor subunit [Rubrivivax benzoatilyticus]
MNDNWTRRAALVAAVVVAGCAPADDETGPAAAPRVTVQTLAPADLAVTEDLQGRVAAWRSAEIRAQVGGIVQQRLFEQGAEVEAGKPLFQIDPRPFQAELEMAAASLQRAEAALARAQLQEQRLAPLVAAEAVSRQAYDDAVSAREQAAAEVALARATLARRRLDLQFTTVTAPIAGRIDQALVSEGALVSAGDTAPMARVQQIDRVYVDLRQPATSAAAALPAAAEVQILDARGAPTGLSGRVLMSGIDVDIGTGERLLRVAVANPQRQLLPGQFVQARLTRAHYDAALTLPQHAVFRVGGQAQVWVVDAQQRAHAVPVELGELVQRRYRVAAGLQAGQQIVVAGGERLHEGAVVAARPWTESQTAVAVRR